MRSPMPHPFRRDADGGLRIIDDELPPPNPLRVHSGMTAAERVAAGVGTPDDMAKQTAKDAAHRAWLNSAEGRAFIASLHAVNPLACLNVPCARQSAANRTDGAEEAIPVHSRAGFCRVIVPTKDTQ